MKATPEIIALTLWYSVAAVGIAIVNDFKSVEGTRGTQFQIPHRTKPGPLTGDAKLGLSSAPVVFGVDTAKHPGVELALTHMESINPSPVGIAPKPV